MNNIALIVDDSKSARFALRKFLESFNYKVEAVESANEAYRSLAISLPQVIFMDHVMPGIDGFEALRAIKSDPRTASLPVIICSSNEGEEFVQQARARGATDVLQKPPHHEQLAGVLACLNNQGTAYQAAWPSSEQAENSLTVTPGLGTDREPTTMERLMATIPPRMAPGTQQLMEALTATIPMPMAAAPSSTPKVQSLREPAVTIQQAVMKSIRGSLPQEPLRSASPMSGLLSMPALSPGDDGIDAMAALRQEMDERMAQLQQKLMAELNALRAQFASFNHNGFDERLRAIANEAAKARTNALASSLEQHLSALRGNLDAVLRAQNERIEQLLQNSRQVAAEEAERTVMSAAQRISDQMAESILKTLGPELASMRRL